MDATTFISKKHAAAVEELRAIDAEYAPRRDAAQAIIAMTQKWMDELGVEKPAAEQGVSLQDAAKNAATSWTANRDLNPQARPQ